MENVDKQNKRRVTKNQNGLLLTYVYKHFAQHVLLLQRKNTSALRLFQASELPQGKIFLDKDRFCSI